jgi:hypothetical protein
MDEFDGGCGIVDGPGERVPHMVSGAEGRGVDQGGADPFSSGEDAVTHGFVEGGGAFTGWGENPFEVTLDPAARLFKEGFKVFDGFAGCGHVILRSAAGSVILVEVIFLEIFFGQLAAGFFHEFLDAFLDAVEFLIAEFRQFQPLFEAGFEFVKGEAALLERVDDFLEALEGLLEFHVFFFLRHGVQTPVTPISLAEGEEME